MGDKCNRNAVEILDKNNKDRYRVKFSLINDTDPYVLPTYMFEEAKSQFNYVLKAPA